MKVPRITRLLVGAASVAAAVFGVVACRSVSKDTVESTLLALGKNAKMRETGIERRRFTLTLDGREVQAEAVLFHAKARRPAVPKMAPVVLVHGTPGSLFTWNELIYGKDGAGGLAEERDVWAFDVLGHGMTRTEDRPVTFAKCADWVVAVCREIGDGPVHLVGNSYGGEFCWRAALDHPELFRTLTLMDSAGYARAEGGFLPEEVAMREMSLAPIGWLVLDREKMRGALAPHFPGPVTLDQVEEAYVVSVHSGNWKAMVDLARDENGTRESEIPRISVPTLLLWGADDIAYPVETVAKRFHRDIPGSELLVLPACGHYPQETLPGDVVRALNEFHRRRP